MAFLLAVFRVSVPPCLRGKTSLNPLPEVLQQPHLSRRGSNVAPCDQKTNKPPGSCTESALDSRAVRQQSRRPVDDAIPIPFRNPARGAVRRTWPRRSSLELAGGGASKPDK